MLLILTVLVPLIRSDVPPYANIDRVTQIAQNFDKLQEAQRQILDHQKQSDQTQLTIALILYSSQRDQAQAQIDAARREGKRDLAAEALKTNAEQAIMALTSQVQPAAK